jgi:hypothetical protein
VKTGIHFNLLSHTGTFSTAWKAGIHFISLDDAQLLMTSCIFPHISERKGNRMECARRKKQLKKCTLSTLILKAIVAGAKQWNNERTMTLAPG